MVRTAKGTPRVIAFPPSVPPRLPISMSGQSSVVDLGQGVTIRIHNGPEDSILFAGTVFWNAESIGRAHTSSRWEGVLLRCLAEALEHGCYPLPPGFTAGECTVRIIDQFDRKEIQAVQPNSTPHMIICAQRTDRLSRLSRRQPLWHALAGPGKVSYPSMSDSPGEALLMAIGLRQS